ncbi:MAG TPA: hypothetical protein PLJ21_06810 [Pseudobdellovibrionaceae bacterium]|nr:hypothetical protein [Pseudobdellovibrionaceae bacterium]
MKSLTRNLFALMALSLLVFNTSVKASNFPSDYNIWSDKQFNGPITVLRSLRADGTISLDIAYTGHLNYENNPLIVMVKANYNDGSRVKYFNLFPYSEGYRKANATRISTGCLRGNLGGCEVPSSDDMRELLYWAAGTKGLNQLSLEIAILSPNTKSWDSNYGDHYKFIFPQYDRP